MGFAAIEKKIAELGLRARDGKLLSDQVTEAVIVYVAVNADGSPRQLPERGPDFKQYW